MTYFHDDMYFQYEKRVKRGVRKLCKRCQKRNAVYFSKRTRKRKSKKRVRTGKWHTLCIQCYSEELDRRRGEREAALEAAERRKKEKERVKQELIESLDERKETKCNFRRAQRRWSKAKTLSRVAGRRAKAAEEKNHV